MRLCLLAAVAALLCGSAKAAVCTPEEFGGRPGGVVDATKAIQSAIDKCAGGGTVKLSGGTYLSGPLEMRSELTLQIDEGSVLLGTADHEAYRNSKGATTTPLIGGNELHDVRLVGKGAIDGQGASWWKEFRAAKKAGGGDLPLRPKMIVLIAVTNLEVRDLTLRNSPMFHLVPIWSRNVMVDHVTITAPADSPNTDGIDPSNSSDMVIQNSMIDVGDDNVAIKIGHEDPAHPNAASGNIVVRDCEFRNGHGMSIGSETNGGFHNLLVERIHFIGTKTGIRIKTDRGRGGVVTDAIYRDITMENVGQAILITAYYPKILEHDEAQPVVSGSTPDISRIRIERLKAVGSQSAGQVIGLPEKFAREIALDHVDISAKTGFAVTRGEVAFSNSRIAVLEGKALIRGEGATVTGLE
jgi:polygalacturonase